MTFAAVPPTRAAFAGGLILGVAGLGNALGPLIGGLLTDEVSWRAIFFLNLPIAAFAAAVTWAKIHQPATTTGASGSTTRGIVSALARARRCCCWRSTSPRTGAGATRGCSAMVAVALDLASSPSR